MGIANKIPGVSGGAIAWSFGFYQDMIDAFQNLNKTNFNLIFSHGFNSFFKKVNGLFLVILFTGSSFANVSVSFALDFLFDFYESYVWIFFIGLILATAYYLFKSISIIKNILFIILGLLIGVLFSVIKPIPENNALWFVFISGYISVSGMTLPGLSGSFLLILLGMYKLCMVDTITNLIRVIQEILLGNLDVLKEENVLELLLILLIFVVGSFVGLVTLSKLIKRLFENHQIKTTAVIGSFILGSIGVIWPWREQIGRVKGQSVLLSNRYIPDLNIELVYHGLVMIAGVLIVFFIEKRKEKNKI